MTNQDVIETLASKEITTENLTVTGTVTESGATKTRTGQVYHFPANAGKAGAGAGYATANNTGTVTMPASTGASTWTIPLQLKAGDIITAFMISGQLESGGNANVLDADLRATTAAAGALTDASLGAITQVSETADHLLAASKTLVAPHTVISGNSYYVLVTGTTLAATDQDIQGVEVTVTEK